ncbi:MAG: relA 1 [Candidatus Doudnabacteria bacterium]|nr:relA 1 [Candidatus Doudnabacteria bacterium]
MDQNIEARLAAQSAGEGKEINHPFIEDEEAARISNPVEAEYEKVELENRASFLKRLEGLPIEVINTIDFAYDLGKEAHRPHERDTGERYFEHLRAVALILIDECKIKDPDLIIACLLHDSVEDSAMFGNATQAYSKWKEVAEFRLRKVFNSQVADIVITLTKPKVDGQELKTKAEAHHFYIENLSNAPAKTILAKMADRLHNLRSLAGTTPEKQRRIVAETREIYFPLFQKALAEYPTEGQYMLDEMETAITKLG